MKSIAYHKIMENVKKYPSFVHCITNYVTVNDVANMILASGASTIMADDKREVEDITSICTSLVINMGTLNERTIESMILAGKKANELGHPVIFDPVGAGASGFRTETAQKLMQEIKFSVIRGNISEIKTICQRNGRTMGVDANEMDAVTESNMKDIIAMAQELAASTGSVIAITGAVDLVVDTENAYAIYNGDADMAKITGTGCMLDGVIGGFAGSNQSNILDAVVSAISAMGLCGQYAKERCHGTSSMKMHLIDAMSNLTIEQLERGKKVESKC